MYTSLIALVLVGAVADTSSVSWQSYDQAGRQVQAEKKPMAVFIGSGEKGWEMVAGGLSSEASQMLATSYVCAYVDISSPEGKRLTEAFQMKKGAGVVLSDRTGQTQAFWHDGSLSQNELVRQLVRHQAGTRTSFYPTETVMTGLTGAVTGSMQAGSYCPTCSGGSVRRR